MHFAAYTARAYSEQDVADGPTPRVMHFAAYTARASSEPDVADGQPTPDALRRGHAPGIFRTGRRRRPTPPVMHFAAYPARHFQNRTSPTADPPRGCTTGGVRCSGIFRTGRRRRPTPRVMPFAACTARAYSEPDVADGQPHA